MKWFLITLLATILAAPLPPRFRNAVWISEAIGIPATLRENAVQRHEQAVVRHSMTMMRCPQLAQARMAHNLADSTAWVDLCRIVYGPGGDTVMIAVDTASTGGP